MLVVKFDLSKYFRTMQASAKFERIKNQGVVLDVKSGPNEFGEIHFDNISYSVPRYAYKFWNNGENFYKVIYTGSY